jgi:chemotaxis protein methyltransferase CheR
MSIDLTHVQFEGKPTVSRRRVQRSPGGVERRTTLELPARRQASPRVGGLPAFVLSQAGLIPSSYRAAPLERRTGACLRAVKVTTERAAREQLITRPELLGAALSTLLIGVSAFFRDAPVFDALRATVVPALKERAAPIRVWSIGCSTGAELYSVAILLDEAGLLDRVRLLGTDCRPDAVSGARHGTFTEEEMAGVTAEQRSRHFERVRSGWRVNERLRERIHWEVADATRVAAPGQWDLVLCRNLVIYLEEAAAEAMLRRIVAHLSPQGFLVVGKAERPAASFGLAPVARCVYRKP